MWNRFLILLGWRTDWNDPKNAPPAFSVAPHAYKAHDSLLCCSECGGGSANAIHKGKQVAYRPVEMTAEAAAKMKEAPASHPMAEF